MSAPAPSDLAAMPVHVVVRDFPETLAVFRASGVDVPASGGRPVREATDDTRVLIDALAEAVRRRAA